MYNYRQTDPESLQFYNVGQLTDLEDGEQIFVEIGDVDLVIFKIADQVFAIGDVCSHDGAPLGDGEIEDFEVICPRHGARFDVQSGKAMALPAVEDIPAYPVRIKEGQIEVGVPSGE